MSEKQNNPEIIEDAIAKRLGKLAALPVDTSRLDRALRAELPAPPAARRDRLRRWLRPLSAVAASFVVILGLTFALAPAGEVRADPVRIAQIHRELVAGKDTVHVPSMDEANRMIRAMAAGFVQVPNAPPAHVHACCMKNIKNKRVACLLLENQGVPVTMTVASAADVRCPDASRGAVLSYHISRVGDLNMVMTSRAGRWVCLVSQADVETLIGLAGRLEF